MAEPGQKVRYQQVGNRLRKWVSDTCYFPLETRKMMQTLKRGIQKVQLRDMKKFFLDFNTRPSYGTSNICLEDFRRATPTSLLFSLCEQQCL